MRRIEGRKNQNTKDSINNFYANRFNESIIDLRNKLFYNEILEWIPNDATSLLDMGCGTGYGLDFIRRHRKDLKLTGYDLSKVAIKLAKDIYENIVFDIFDLYQDTIYKFFDVILLLETLEHLEDPKAIINKLLCSCQSLIISVPYKKYLKNEKAHLYTDFTRESFEDFEILSSKVIGISKKRKSKRYLYIRLAGKYYEN